MFYLFTHGSYSDYHHIGLLEGPDGADIPALTAAWVPQAGDAVLLADEPAASFVAWLALQPGWREPAMEERNLDDAEFSPSLYAEFGRRRIALHARFVTAPPDAGCPAENWYRPGEHSWRREVGDGGALYWKCYRCERRVPAEAGSAP